MGDGFLFEHNPFYRRIRKAALTAGFTYTTRDPDAYFAFPLTALDTVLESRKIPFRDNVRALRRLEHARPGFFELADLRLNRPTPNYLLHESAHAVAFRELFGTPASVRQALSTQSALLGIELGEAYAMTSEYLASAVVADPLHRFLFSVNSYRHRTPGKKAMGELISELGLERTTLAILLAFLCNLYFRERLSKASAEQLLIVADAIVGKRPRTRALSTAHHARARRALNELMRMDSDFRTDTTRLFLAMFGHGRNVKRLLKADPLELIASDAETQRHIARLVRTLTEDAVPAKRRATVVR